MKSKVFYSGLLLATLLGGCSKDTEQTASPDSNVATRSATEESLEIRTPPTSPRPAMSPAKEDLSAYICRNDCFTTGPLEAKSEAEAAWMAKHKYPTQKEIDRLGAMSLSELEHEYKAGNPTAAVVLGKKISLERNFFEGQAILRDQTMSGNTYAFYAMSDSYLDKSQPNLVEGIAFLRIAYLLGDYKAAREIGNLGLTSVEVAAGDARALRLLNLFAAGQQPDPRPEE